MWLETYRTVLWRDESHLIMDADRREAEGVGGAEEGRVEERKDGINVGEYCGH